MANHSHLALSRPIVHSDVGAVLARANAEVFLGLLELEETKDKDAWWLGPPGGSMGCRVWKAEYKKNSLALRSGPGEFASWIEWTLLGELKAEFGGRTSGDGPVTVPRREFPTWKSYFDMIYPGVLGAGLWKMQIRSLKCPVLKALASVKLKKS